MNVNADRPPVRRSRLLVATAGLVAFSSAVTILYAGVMPVLPLSDQPVPLAMNALGITGLAATVGIYVRQAWGRALGVGTTLIGSAIGILATARTVSDGTMDPFPMLVTVALDVVLSIAFTGFVLWVLLRRWPSRG